MNTLTPDQIKQLLAYDPSTGAFVWRPRDGWRNNRAGRLAGAVGKDGYVRISIQRKSYLAHRLAWAHVYGEWPSHWLDHVNRNRADNRIINLRGASAGANAQNTPRYQNNKSGCKGVYAHSWGKWEAYITINRKRIYLGVYESLQDAKAARLAAQDRLFTHAGDL
jgi:hypothetical protein